MSDVENNITTTIVALRDKPSADKNFLFAATLNLYGESLRRMSGRILYGPADVERITRIFDLITNHPRSGELYEPAKRPSTASIGEELAILAAQMTDAAAEKAEPVVESTTPDVGAAPKAEAAE